MTDDEILDLHETATGLVLALMEKLAEKLAPGSYLPILSKTDVDAIVKRQQAMVEKFKQERREAASKLITPPWLKEPK